MRQLVFGALCTMWAGVSPAAVTLTSTIEALQIHPATNGGYVKLTSFPTINEGACSAQWAYGDLDDEKFMIYIWPALMLAHSKGRTVTIHFSGCLASSSTPRIAWVQVNAGSP